MARKLRGCSRRVVGIGLQDATSDLLVRSCDDFVIYDGLMERDEQSNTFQLSEARQFVLSALQSLLGRHAAGRVPLAALAEDIAARRPDMDISQLGFASLAHLLEAQKEVVLVAQPGEDPLVAFRSTYAIRNEINQTLQYRTALNTAGYRLVDRETRQDVLQSLYILLSSEPGIHTLDGAIRWLKEQYDGANLLRSRDDVQEVAQLIKQAGVLASQPESWELDSLTLFAGAIPISLCARLRERLCSCAGAAQSGHR